MKRPGWLYRRLRAVACGYWGCTPATLDAQAASGAILLRDVLDAFALASSDPFNGAAVARFVLPHLDGRARSEKHKRQFDALLRMATPRDEASQAYLEALMDGH